MGGGNEEEEEEEEEVVEKPKAPRKGMDLQVSVYVCVFVFKGGSAFGRLGCLGVGGFGQAL
jgi:hypothetical protein